jgi:predicted dehydrogenase
LSVKAVAESGEIGRVYRIESRVMGSNGIPGAWRKNFEQGGGMMLDWGVHLIDQMLLWIDEPIDSIFCDYSFEAGENVDDGFDLEVRFKSGLIYRIVVDTNSFIELPRWQVYGTDGTATVTNCRRDDVEGRVVRCVLRHDDKLEGVNAGNGFTKTMAARRSETVEDKPLVHVRGDKNAFYANYMDAVLKGEPTTVRKEQVLKVFRVMELARESALRNEVIKF